MTEPQELTEAEWLHDLRTTKAKQAKEFLRDGRGGYCCLGRACVKDSRVKASDSLQYRFNGTLINSMYLEYSGLALLSWMSADQAKLCTKANDNVGMSFAEIADWWEAGQPTDDDGNPVRVVK